MVGLDWLLALDRIRSLRPSSIKRRRSSSVLLEEGAARETCVGRSTVLPVDDALAVGVTVLGRTVTLPLDGFAIAGGGVGLLTGGGGLGGASTMRLTFAVIPATVWSTCENGAVVVATSVTAAERT